MDDRAEELAFMKRPQSWPLWPFLGIVRRDPSGKVTTGVLVDGEEGLLAVEDANVYQVGEALRDPSRLRAVDVEKLVDDGWRVD